ncbi:GNAT family N-acetyltransferase [Pseudocolwellia sp. AS88]|uniref:GNAT family N-acetyltransferase n=1 Tax=Pseudocolwellia sp. AS88 TaxID=3063958 RepID=UPI0026EC0FFF|nr:GNAT family N-acetyltransferase [Pseudocolwellia sp. AS88]MDO7084104.1 GNAT family N-acetyltransferase [Pseudocolwellia sp. AS88]
MTSIKKVEHKITWQLIDSIDELIAIEPQWQLLVGQSSYLSPFSSPQWILTWYKIYWQKNWQLSTFVGYIDSELVVMLPCYIQHSTKWPYLKVLYPLGQGEPEEEEISSEYCDVIVSTNITEITLVGLQEKLMALNIDQVRWNATVQNSYIKKLFEKSFGYETRSTHTRYYVERSKWSLKSLSKNTRSRYKRSINQLNKIDATFHWVDPKDYEQYITLLIKYHQKLWHSRNKDGAFSHASFKDFHEKYRAQSSIKISAITVNGTPIAINYYFYDQTSLYFYQSGWDSEQYSNFSLGLSLHLWSIENCHYKYYDFMMGEMKDSYKEKLGVQQQPMINMNITINRKRVFILKLMHKIMSFIQ